MLMLWRGDLSIKKILKRLFKCCTLRNNPTERSDAKAFNIN